MATIKVWTKQHENVLRQLRRDGRYLAQKRYISADLQEHAGLVLETYDWLVSKAEQRYPRPDDVSYPVWVSFSYEATMLPSLGTVILELDLEEERIIPVNIGKWGMILNYSYIPANEADDKRHKQLLKDYGVDDQRALMTQFYPAIRREIVASWDRLFDESLVVTNEEKYGIVWELREEWLVREVTG